MDKIRNVWSEDVDVTEMGDADFESRNTGRPASDMEGVIGPIAETLSDHWDLSVNETMDAVVRIYIAHLIDSGQLAVSREDWDIGYLIPPEGWTEELDRPLFEVDIDGEKNKHTLSLPQTVDDLIGVAYEDGIVENKAQLVVMAHEWLCRTDGNLYHNTQ